MVSLRFPFFSPPRRPHGPSHAVPRPFSASVAACAVAAGAVAAAAAAVSQKNKIQEHPFLRDALNFFLPNFARYNQSTTLWGSLSLDDNPSPVVESKTGASFPSVLSNSGRLLGIGLRKKSVLGLKNIDVYAFGVYADDNDMQKLLREKYGKLSISQLKGNTQFSEDLMERDICVTIRLQIVYRRLSIRSVRSAFEESVGSRLEKFGGSENRELLKRFTSQFKDEYKIPRGSIIDLSREHGYILRTRIDGKEVGCIQSKLLCRSILDLYIGEDPFDRKAKEDIELNLATLLQK
ncbi:fatty-acid-binding protein 1 [Malania oleifera]|uniref:fatty-acid-binding protein 1 n=1 Tax=Malania oleifera TaxID=397392 RepID=UPI0025ADA638|nr:fatty-acid-binding protein 1 [Malania oleifera]